MKINEEPTVPQHGDFEAGLGPVSYEKEAEAALREALKEDRLVVNMQPTVDLKTGKVVAADLLVRWRRPPGNIEMARGTALLSKKNGLIREIADFMIEQVCRIIFKWRQEGKPLVPVSINIAEKNMLDKKFVAKVKEQIKRYNIPPYILELTLEEGMGESEAEELIRSTRSLRRLGIRFAVGDFGTSAFPLKIICKMPVDVLKMDKDFFDNIHLSEKERAMLTHIIRLAKSVDMKVRYEGIKTEGQEALLKGAGCDLGQGDLYGGPMSEELFQRLLAAQ